MRKLLAVVVLVSVLSACGGPKYSYEPFGNREVVTTIPETKIEVAPMHFDSDTSIVQATYMLATVKGYDAEINRLGAEYIINLALLNTEQFFLDEFAASEENLHPLASDIAIIVNSQDFAKEANFSNPRIKVNINLLSSDGVVMFRVTNDYTYDRIDELY